MTPLVSQAIQERVLAALTARVNGAGLIEASIPVLAEAVGVSETSTKRSLRSLREAGRLEMIPGEGKVCNIYRVKANDPMNDLTGQPTDPIKSDKDRQSDCTKCSRETPPLNLRTWARLAVRAYRVRQAAIAQIAAQEAARIAQEAAEEEARRAQAEAEAAAIAETEAEIEDLRVELERNASEAEYWRRKAQGGRFSIEDVGSSQSLVTGLPPQPEEPAPALVEIKPPRPLVVRPDFMEPDEPEEPGWQGEAVEEIEPPEIDSQAVLQRRKQRGLNSEQDEDSPIASLIRSSQEHLGFGRTA